MHGGGGARPRGLPSAAHHLGSRTKRRSGRGEGQSVPRMCTMTGPTRCVSFKQRWGDDVLHKNKQMQYAIECNTGGVFYSTFFISHVQARLTFQNLLPCPNSKGESFCFPLLHRALTWRHVFMFLFSWSFQSTSFTHEAVSRDWNTIRCLQSICYLPVRPRLSFSANWSPR